MLKKNGMARAIVGLLVVASLMTGATAAIAAETDRTTDRVSDVAAHRPVAKFGHWIVTSTMEILDVERGDVVATWAGGGTLADLAAANGSSGDALVAALVDMAQDRVDEAVANGTMTDEQAARFMARITEAIDKAVFATHDVPGKVRRHLALRHLLWTTTLDVLDVNRGDIMSTFARGGTLADLAEEQGSSGDALAAALTDAVADKLADAVANGSITEEQKAEALEKAARVIEKFVFSPHKPGRGTGQVS